MAYTGPGPAENDTAADLLAELIRKTNRGKIAAIVEERVAECLAVLSGRAAKHYVERENVEALLETYGSAEKIKETFDIDSDDIGFFLIESTRVAADEAILLSWILLNKAGVLDVKELKKGAAHFFAEFPLEPAAILRSCVEMSLSNGSVVSEWLAQVGPEKIKAVRDLQTALAQVDVVH